MTRLFAVLVSLLIASRLAAQEEVTVVDASEAGFRLSIPNVGWMHKEVREDAGLSALVLGPEDGGGRLEMSIRVSNVADSTIDGARAQGRELRGAIAADPSISEVEDFEIEIAGRTAPGLRVVQEAFGEVFRANVVFLRARGFQYRIQFHAPRGEFDEQWAIAQRVLRGFELTELDAAAQERVTLRALAARCGSQVDWAANWDEAAERARVAGRLIVVSIHAQPGFELGNRLNESVFMSPEVLALMEHRFVGVRWSSGQPAPFVDHDVFGLSGTTFGVGLLVCTPEGEVVRQLYLLAPVLVADGLRATLLEYPEFASAPAPPRGSRAEKAAFFIDSGQLDAARDLLRAARSTDRGAVSYERTRLHRIHREGDAALLELARAREENAANGSGPTPAVMHLEEAAIQIGVGRNELAAAALERCLDDDPGERSRAAAMLLQGVLAWGGGDRTGAKTRWTELTRALPDQPAAWMAAAAILGPALEIELQPNLSWPTAVTAQMAVVPEKSAPPTSTPRIRILKHLHDAVTWLVDAQRADGGWDLPFAAGNTHPAPDPITMASQAICTRALARDARVVARASRDRATLIRAAAQRGLDRYLVDRALVREHPRPVAFMDYTCWGSSYGLLLVTAVLDPRGGMVNTLSATARDAVEAEAAHLVDDLVRIQAPNGGWSYYLSGTVDGASMGAAMSFTTATVLLALDAAKTGGIDVPDDVLERGYACLASMRGTNGVFQYMRGEGEPHSAGFVDPAGAAARGPVCTLALQRAGLLGFEAMEPAFVTFVEHLGSFGREARKALMHAGPAGQGSHYLLYDYSTAAETLHATDDGALTAETRDDVVTAILHELERCRNADGSFIDNPIIGCAPGTGLAVLTLLDLRGPVLAR